MRTRKLLSIRKLVRCPQLRRLQDPELKLSGTSSPSSLESGPKDLRFSNGPHSDTVRRTGLGLFEYTTGLLPSRPRGLWASAPKLYAKRPVNFQTWQRPLSTSTLGTLSDGPGQTELTQPRQDDRIVESEEDYPPNRNKSHTLIALGSNVGDRLACIEDACRALDADPDIRVIRTSSLYETKAMYVEDQANFLNGVCEIETNLDPLDLLDRTQAIEQQLGRTKTINKGPRNIDLDILLHGDTVIETERLTIPHPLMLERHFVLYPMFDFVQMSSLLHPRTRRTFQHHAKALGPPNESMDTVTPLGEGCPSLRPLDSKQSTAVMSILNVTPDSFSDGGDNTLSIDDLREVVRSQIAAGATIIDVGGQSSRPNAPDVTTEEETSRVLPAIEAIKSLPEAEGVAISVDTYRAPVAEAAIAAGAHIINDISAGLLDPDMLPTVARLGCTYVMMHMRGTPATMQDAANCEYPQGLINTIRHELSERLAAAEAAGIRRWRIILDPGIGFSKTAEQNVLLSSSMNYHSKGTLRELPWLVGTSRKSFIGRVTGVEEPKERIWGTAATVTAAVRNGADIVRVHDVPEMAQVVKMADAMFRVHGLRRTMRRA